jgi:hypothetical protein
MLLQSSFVAEILFMNDANTRFELVCVRSSGERVPVTVEIGRPYEVRDGDGADFARCPVMTHGLFEKHADISGEDTFQALTLAIRHVDRILTDFVHEGGTILYNDGKTKVEFAAHAGAKALTSQTP